MLHKIYIGTMIFLVELTFILFMTIMTVLALPMLHKIRHEAVFIESVELSRDIFRRWFWFLK